MQVDEARFNSLVEAYENTDGYELRCSEKQFGSITFEETQKNFRSLGDIAISHGLAISAWNPDNKRVWFAPLQVEAASDGIRISHDNFKQDGSGMSQHSYDHPEGWSVLDEDGDVVAAPEGGYQSKKPFDEFLNELFEGSYVVETYGELESHWDVGVCEFASGGGHIRSTDISTAIEHDDIAFGGITDGQMKLNDLR